MITRGYGICYDKANWVEDVNEKITSLLMEKTKYLKEEFEEYCRDFYKDHGTDKTAAVNAFVDEYENFPYLWGGLTGLICDIINEVEFNNRPFFHDEDCCIFVEATVPRNEKDRAAFPTQEDIGRILSRYMNLLTKSPLVITWHEINDD